MTKYTDSTLDISITSLKVIYLCFMNMQDTEWFADWFDTSYYHTLYKNRDFTEAEGFIQRLVDTLDLPKKSSVLDLACGKGRHSVTLSNCGFDVLGVDLSANSIAEAKKFETEGLSFEVHDMREAIPNRTFNAVFNLFTSFGYFDSLNDNLRVIQSIRTMLKDQGILVIDFMNAVRIVNELVEKELKHVDGIDFHIERRYDGTHIFKEIRFDADNQHHSYMERVQALTLNDFVALLEGVDFEILRTFGDFQLNSFEESSSDRLIIIAQLKSWD